MAELSTDGVQLLGDYYEADEIHCFIAKVRNDVSVTDASYKQKVLEVCEKFDEKQVSGGGRELDCNEVTWCF